MTGAEGLQLQLPDTDVFYVSRAKDLAPRDSAILGLLGWNQATQLLASTDPLSRDFERDSVVVIDQHTLLRSLPQLYALAASESTSVSVAVVVDLDLEDYSVVPAVRDVGLPINVGFPNGASLARTGLTFVNFERLLREDALSQDLTAAATLAGTEGATDLIINLSQYGDELVKNSPSDVAVYNISEYKKGLLADILERAPQSISRITLLQGSSRTSSKHGESPEFEPFLLDFFGDFDLLVERNIKQLLLTKIGNRVTDFNQALAQIIDNLRSQDPVNNLFVGESAVSDVQNAEQYHKSVQNVLHLEDAYIKVLRQLLKDNLSIINEYSSPSVNVNSPEYGYGRYLQSKTIRNNLLDQVKKSLDPELFHSQDSGDFVQKLSKWVAFHDKSLDEQQLTEANKLGAEIYQYLKNDAHSKTAIELLKTAGNDANAFLFKSSWLIGSDAWSYDLGNSGVHQILTSNDNINMLIIDSEPYEHRKASKDRKKDVGLYAMNFHNVYVASVAVYSSYTQLLTAFIEAAKYNGPSVVLAYLPYKSEKDTPLEVLQETKVGVESGYWPLYRYDPSKEDNNESPAFSLDSSVIRKQLQTFLEKENKLTLLAKRDPELARNLAQSASDAITQKQNRRAEAALDDLLNGLSGPPLHIYFASDGGNASNLAKRLHGRATARGLKATVLSMDDIILEDLPGEENAVFITSTGGQGEFPQDGKTFWDALKASTDIDLSSLNVSVFGLGDSEYWPRKEDKKYYNKPSQDLFKRLEALGAKFLAPLGLGDDQDADGYQTAYSEWEPKLWEALGVSGIEVEDEPKPITNEDIKLNSDFLRGTIASDLIDESTGTVQYSNEQLMKFHGIYTQEDRDVREIRKSEGLEPAYQFMARARLPGGKCTGQQWLGLDKLSDDSGNGTLKLTTRATFQIHGVLKRNLKHTIRGMNAVLIDTLAAAGDVNRNVMVTTLPARAKVHQQVSDMGAKISEHFLPKTTAYHEIWLDGPEDQDYEDDWNRRFDSRNEGPRKKKTLVSGNALVDIEPIYGPTYMPRKFKFNLTVPPYNDVDVFSADIGLIAIVDEKTDVVEGYNVYVGGGMGTTHGNKKTYPRVASSFGFVKTEELLPALEALLIIQRDYGNRQDRKQARVKYTVDTLSVEVYRQKAEEIWGGKFEPERSYEITSNIDYFGWVKDEFNQNHFTAYIENGRVLDTPEVPHKTGLRKIAEYMKKTGVGHFRLTGNQHLIISDISDEHLDNIKALLAEHKLDNADYTGLRLSSSACVALPTCGLAFAESERYLPDVITQLEDTLEEYGLRHDTIIMRMTGCPNGCSRPWLAELALVGKAPHTYNLYLGGGFYGQRLNKLYRANLNDNDIVDEIKPLFKRYALEKNDGEHFGDFVIRVGIIKPTLEGRLFHEDIAEDAF
ncbi:sulfite reductase (NADPH) subunit beta [Nakaseomyces bracarensis]|uniref:sulfite reductase (NADPH) subunit beta n=1 Tax=Nakaseomyces bracarensis TaxID=273131 RepID=UPI003871EF78